MIIKVKYAMTELEKKLWDITPKFGNAEFEPRADRVAIAGLKASRKEKCSFEKYDFNPLTDEGCKKITGLSPAQYQQKRGYAWSA